MGRSVSGTWEARELVRVEMVEKAGTGCEGALFDGEE